ncbi:MAG: hypothetical protein PHU80_07285 [Kiritimatiellae bacterium]|nr:hypothetical protein [Kiritimatiellia bacterium]
MVTTHSRDNVSGDARSWFVRNEHGRRFGPADFTTLLEWARDGRIGPLNEISSDGIHWSLASAMPEMEMDWVAALAPGSFYGPIHAGALRGLLDEGSVQAEAALFRRDRLDKGGVQAAAEELASLRALSDKLGNEVAEREAEIEALRCNLQVTKEQARLEIGRERERARLQAEESAAESEEIRRLLREHTEQSQEQRRLDAARAAALEDELRHARGELSAVLAQAEKLKEEADKQRRLRTEELSAYEERENAALEDARAALEREAELRGRIVALEKALAETGMAAAAEEGVLDDAEAGAVGFESEGRVSEYVEAEALDIADVPQRLKKHERFIEEADVLPPEQGAEKTSGRRAPVSEAAAGARPAAGLSMAALEAQARRELEMLGAGAKMFFTKTKS